MDKNMFKSRIVIPCRFAYINCWRPSVQYGGIQKYSVSALISKEDIDTINKIEEVIEHVKEQSVQKWGGRIPANIRLPLHDGDVEKPDNPIFQNCSVMYGSFCICGSCYAYSFCLCYLLLFICFW